MKILLLFMLLFMAASVHAYTYDFDYTCHAGCKANTSVTWNITINPGFRPAIDLVNVMVVESQTKTILGINNKSQYLYTNTSLLVKGRLPTYDALQALNVSVCTSEIIDVEDRVAGDYFLGNERTYCQRINHTMPFYQCLAGSDCTETQACVDHRCVALECKACQYISEHLCINHQCCSNDACSLAEECIDHACLPIPCPDGYTAWDHTCIKLECESHEIAQNGRCVALACESHERAENHECVPITCASNEFAANHTCHVLQCGENQTAVDHRCVQTQHSEGTALVFRTGVPDQESPFFSILELVLLSIIAVLLFIVLHNQSIRQQLQTLFPKHKK